MNLSLFKTKIKGSRLENVFCIRLSAFFLYRLIIFLVELKDGTSAISSTERFANMFVAKSFEDLYDVNDLVFKSI